MADVAIRFADRLDLALKALSIGRGRLAAEVGVDKSLVSRWLSGVVRPSAHNIERLTRLMATHRPGFTMLDWEHDLDVLALRLGVTTAAPSVSLPPLPAFSSASGRDYAPGLLPFGLMQSAAVETARRASAYAGRYRVTRLSSSGKLVPLVEYALIAPDADSGLCLDHCFSNHRLRGWLVVLNGVLYAMTADDGDDSFAFYLLNGVVGPKALVLDGIMTSVGGQRSATPYSAPLVMERVGDAGDRDSDAAWLADAMSRWGPVAPDTLAPEIMAVIAGDFGRTSAAAGGDAVLRIPHERSLARGGF
jgi:hypothetical protein